MTLTLHLSNDQARRLKARAAQHGRSVEEYLLDIAEREALSADEWSTRLKALPDLLPRDVPTLPDEALHRETMYRD